MSREPLPSPPPNSPFSCTYLFPPYTYYFPTYPTEACLSYDKVFQFMEHNILWQGSPQTLWSLKHCEDFQLSSEPSQAPPTLPISSKPHRRMRNCSWAKIEPEALLCFGLCKATPLLPVPSITYCAPVPKLEASGKRSFEPIPGSTQYWSDADNQSSGFDIYYCCK